MARCYDPDDYNGRPVPAERLQQWIGRLRVWAHRYPNQIQVHRGRGGRAEYDLTQLHAVASTRQSHRVARTQ